MDEDIQKVIKNKEIDFNLSFELLKKYSNLINQDRKEEAQKIIIYIIQNMEKIKDDTRFIWSDLIESMGFYPYIQKYKDKIILTDTASEIRKEYFKSKNIPGIYLHEEQINILNKINAGKNLVISAPTSFGKSLLIEEIVASKRYKNIIIIQPTLALLDETRKKLNKYNNDYKIIVRTSQKYSIEKGNIFLLTAERVLEYTEFPNIDFFVLDEFYKISSKRDDERYEALNNSMNLIVNKYKSKFLLLGPNIEGISENFIKRYNAEFYKTKYSLVVNEEVDYFSRYEGQFGENGKKRKYKEEKLFELLYNLKDEQTIIFCSSPDRVRKYANEFVKYLKIKSSEEIDLPIIEWIRENISKDWSIIDCLKYKVGIHDGGLPKHITSSVIKYFNEKKLRYLFCTTTIIEGVNTSAKNIIYFDKTKGNRTPIDFFDYSNIKGRAGRMMEHLIGRIYNFNEPPKEEKTIIDVPFIEQNPIPDEILIHLQENDIINKNTKQNEYIKSIDKDLKEIYRKNGVLVRGQERIYNNIENEFDYELISWKGMPKYSQLAYVLKLAWDNLIKPGETVRPMTYSKLVKQVFDYGAKQSINYLIKNNFTYYKGIDKKQLTDKELMNIAIKDAFKVQKHWIQYKVPKWLNVVNSIQEYICLKKGLKPGNYTFYSGMLENDFIQENLSILNEYNIPGSAIKKISKKIPSTISEDNLLNYIFNNDLINKSGLLEYEKEIIKDNFYENRN